MEKSLSKCHSLLLRYLLVSESQCAPGQDGDNQGSLDTQFDWNDTTVIQPLAGLNRIVPYIRGRVLGGSSSISERFIVQRMPAAVFADFELCTLDFLFHQYCTQDDWNRLADVSGDAGWRWSNMRQYVAKVERTGTLQLLFNFY